MTMTNPTTATRAPGWMKLALVVSLSVNLGVLGLVGGSMLRQSDPDLAGLDRRQKRIVAMVPQSRRAEAVALLRAQSGEVQTVKGAIAAADTAMLQTMREATFDPSRLAAALASRREAQTQLYSLTHTQLVELTKTMTEAERREMAEQMAAASERWADRARARD